MSPQNLLTLLPIQLSRLLFKKIIMIPQHWTQWRWVWYSTTTLLTKTVPPGRVHHIKRWHFNILRNKFTLTNAHKKKKKPCLNHNTEQFVFKETYNSPFIWTSDSLLHMQGSTHGETIYCNWEETYLSTCIHNEMSN